MAIEVGSGDYTGFFRLAKREVHSAAEWALRNFTPAVE